MAADEPAFLEPCNHRKRPSFSRGSIDDRLFRSGRDIFHRHGLLLFRRLFHFGRIVRQPNLQHGPWARCLFGFKPHRALFSARASGRPCREAATIELFPDILGMGRVCRVKKATVY